MTLTAEDFPAFFKETYGVSPFPWQQRLVARLAAGEGWPKLLDLPTGAGKTAAIDIAVFHLALEAERSGHEDGSRRAPVRIVFVVDRRLVVDDAWRRARHLEKTLREPCGHVTRKVAVALRQLADDGPPLFVRRLRGGIPREGDWARTPTQPTVLCSTVDQVGSRLLFRGYGVSDRMKAVHAGLIGSDCLILLDEAHLAEPFRQTLERIRCFRSPAWRERDLETPWHVCVLTATPGGQDSPDLALSEEDRLDPVLGPRLRAAKPACLIIFGRSEKKGKGDTGEAGENVPEEKGPHEDLKERIAAFAEQLTLAVAHFREGQADQQDGPMIRSPAIAIVVNRIARARALFAHLCRRGPLLESERGVEDGERSSFSGATESLAIRVLLSEGTEADVMLLIGPARAVDRDRLVDAVLEKIRTGRSGTGRHREGRLERPLILISTQCIEAGVDIDLDALITELAPLDALRQRFGRLNRAGASFRPFAVVLASSQEVKARAEDPIYSRALAQAWTWLKNTATRSPQIRRKSKSAELVGVVDFRIEEGVWKHLPPEALSPKPNAPVLMPAHVDLLSQTAPIPHCDPDPALYLHGPDRAPDAVTVIWRSDLDVLVKEDERTSRLLALVPPRPGEAIELPVWVLRRWLENRGDPLLDHLGDAMGRQEDLPQTSGQEEHFVFSWKGSRDGSSWMSPAQIRPGMTIIVPGSYGGLDRFGWNPTSRKPVADVALAAAEPYAGRRYAVRVAPGLLVDPERETDEDGRMLDPEELARLAESREADLAETLAALESELRWQVVREALRDLPLPTTVREALDRLDHARGRVEVEFDLYGRDREGRPYGVVFVAPRGLKEGEEKPEEAFLSVTEDDTLGSFPGRALSLERHARDVAEKACRFARTAGLPPELVADLELAGFLHDLGKADPRFQALLHHGDPLGFDAQALQPEEVLAKSAGPVPRGAWQAVGLPRNWRHEALSVRLALCAPGFAQAHDPELVLWLIGTHHGFGRPFFPHADPADDETRDLPPVPGVADRLLHPKPGPQALDFFFAGTDWAGLFNRLKRRYGAWELARLEAILRLADHRASEEAALRMNPINPQAAEEVA